MENALVHEIVQNLRSMSEPFSENIQPLIPAMLHEIFKGRAKAA